MMKGKIFGKAQMGVMLIFMLMLMVSLSGCGQDPQGQTGTSADNGSGSEKAVITMAGVKPGGGTHIITEGVAEVIRKDHRDWNLSVVPGSTMGNLVSIQNDEADLGLSFSPTVYEGIDGIGDFNEKIPDLRFLVALDEDASHFLIDKKLGVDSISDIKEKKIPLRIAVQYRGSGAEVLAKRVLNEYGITYEDIESWGGTVSFQAVPESVEMFKDGVVDAVFFVCGFPEANLIDLFSVRDIKPLPIDDNVVESIMNKYKGYLPITLPGGVYEGMDVDAPGIGQAVILATSTKLPEEIGYEMAKSIVDNLDTLTASYQALSGLTPELLIAPLEPELLHPGVHKYFTEIGVLK
jgi:TRAP transporter TAXI family solute receptor